MAQMDQVEQDGDDSGEDKEEVKRIIINMLHGQEMSTPEIRRCFKMTNSEVWKVISELEEAQMITRTQKLGRTQMWTSSI
jgi:DNA-binding transcriptional regulator GbsR (MarR family)